MSQASDFENSAKSAEAIIESLGKSGKNYTFFFFRDHSITASQKVPTGTHGAAEWDFTINVKAALRDCGIEDDKSKTTYQLGRDLLKKLKG